MLSSLHNPSSKYTPVYNRSTGLQNTPVNMHKIRHRFALYKLRSLRKEKDCRDPSEFRRVIELKRMVSYKLVEYPDWTDLKLFLTRYSGTTSERIAGKTWITSTNGSVIYNVAHCIITAGSWAGIATFFVLTS